MSRFIIENDRSYEIPLDWHWFDPRARDNESLTATLLTPREVLRALDRATEPDANDAIGWNTNSDNIYARGEAMRYEESQSDWDHLTTEDFLFRTYAEPTSEVVTDGWMRVGSDSEPMHWNRPGLFVGSEESADFSQAIDTYMQLTIELPDRYGYFEVPDVFHSSSGGIMLVWSTKIDYSW